MAIDFTDINTLMYRDVRIPIDTPAEYDDALRAVRQVYADVGHAIGGEEINDMESRIRNGQTLPEVVANAYDDAQRRFKTVDTPASRLLEAQGKLPSYDAQLQALTPEGRESAVDFQIPSVMLEQLTLPSREVAELNNPLPATSVQGLARMNAGPTTPMYPRTMNGAMAPREGIGGLGGLSWATILLFAGGAVLVFMIARRFLK